MRRSLIFSLSFLLLGGCAANTVGVTPSQNGSLRAVSPSTTSASQDGAMQRGLDSWLKQEWTPLTTSTSQEEKKVSTTVITVPTVEEEENTSFTLQHYADKWKTYHENKEKLKEGKAKEPSSIENLEKLPVVGK